MEIDLKRNKTLTGIVKRHPDGFGFFVPDEKGLPDVYIPKQFMQGVMTNDKVEVSVYPEPGGNRVRGEIKKVISRSFTRVIGKFQNLNSNFGVLMDTNNNWGANLNIPKAQSMDAKNNELVVVQILTYPKDKEQFTGKVLEVLGNADDPLYDIKKVIINHKIPDVFPTGVEKESEEFSPDVDPKNFPQRRDLTKMPLITIDGKTAKDFDDAIYVETTPNGFHLVVAIADVSHYVKIGSAIDKEAYERGTSVYFPNFVVPMLPEVLSNELCSLKPKVFRLCVVADMQMDFQGNVTKSEFYEAIMNSHARVTYGEAQEVIDGNCPEQFTHVKDVILKAADLAKILMAKRFQNGSLDLEIPETEIIVDELGQPVDIIRSERIFAHRLIEEMMLSANVAVAKFIGQNNQPVLYRIHEPPKLENIELLNRFLATFGSDKQLSSKKLQKDITKALQEFSGKPEEIVLNILTLRSMNQAKYSPENVGHFGLGFQDYSHFTSPIRRYPDLIVHRVLKNVIGVPGYEIPAESTLESAGTFLSAAEQRSVKAERQLQSIKKARFMKKYEGEEFDGIISSVAKFGIFVLLRQFDVDGLVKIEDLGDDHFMYVEEKLMLKGKRSGKEFSIGDVVKIQVASCNPEVGQIDFVIPGLLPSVKSFRDRDKKHGQNNHRENHKAKLKGIQKSYEKRQNHGKQETTSNDGRTKILKMLDEGVERGHANQRGKNENDRGRPGKTRFSKRSRKGKTR
jgi:ribonuclease R